MAWIPALRNQRRQTDNRETDKREREENHANVHLLTRFLTPTDACLWRWCSWFSVIFNVSFAGMLLFLCKQNLYEGRLTATKCVLRDGQGEKINYIEASRHKQHGRTRFVLAATQMFFLRTTTSVSKRFFFLFVSCSTLTLTLRLFCIFVSFVHLSGIGLL